MALAFGSYGQGVTISQSAYNAMIEKGAFLETALEQCDSLYRFEQLTASLLAQKEKYQADKILMLVHDLNASKGNVTICEKNALKREKRARNKGRGEGAGIVGVIILVLLLL